jgi:ubiquinone/menaquinone biosynthesis C-methylase UbiE
MRAEGLGKSVLPKRKEFWQGRRDYDFPNQARFPLEKIDFTPRMSEFPPVVIDVGFGGGETAERLASRGCEIWAFDLNPAKVDEALEKLGYSIFPPKLFLNADFLEINLEGFRSQVDLIVFEHVLTHFLVRDGVDELWEAGKIGKELLLPRGKVVITDWLKNDSPRSPLSGEEKEYWRKRYERDAKILGHSGMIVVFPKELKEEHRPEAMYSEERVISFIEQGKFDRITRHYTLEELTSPFMPWCEIAFAQEFAHTTTSGNLSRGVHLLLRRIDTPPIEA